MYTESLRDQTGDSDTRRAQVQLRLPSYLDGQGEISETVQNPLQGIRKRESKKELW